MRRLAIPLLAVALLTAGCGTKTVTSTTSAGSCSNVAKPAARKPQRLRAPAAMLDPSKRWTLTFTTSCGTFVVTLAPRTSPHATASLVALARRGYFDGTIFHRIVPGYIVQGGDPTQSSQGGPGYTTVDVPAADTRYARGDVAMGKTEIEPRGTAGSQFFVLTADAPSLAPDYADIGRVTRGMDVVERIGDLGDPTDPNGAPTQTVVVEKVTAASR
jgi:cyclophilin family peptidyl-prolyl cis-trans isomerase